MLAAYAQIDRQRAIRQLDAAQAAAYPMMGDGAKRWLDDLIERVRGVVTDTSERREDVTWNGKVVDIRTFRRDWERHEAESSRPHMRQSGRQLVNRLRGRAR